MKSDTIHVLNDGTGIEAALEQVEKVAAFKGLNEKDSRHLRLLAEEMLPWVNWKSPRSLPGN